MVVQVHILDPTLNVLYLGHVGEMMMMMRLVEEMMMGREEKRLRP
jgi:hypothetical protein